MKQNYIHITIKAESRDSCEDLIDSYFIKDFIDVLKKLGYHHHLAPISIRLRIGLVGDLVYNSDHRMDLDSSYYSVSQGYKTSLLTAEL